MVYRTMRELPPETIKGILKDLGQGLSDEDVRSRYALGKVALCQVKESKGTEIQKLRTWYGQTSESDIDEKPICPKCGNSLDAMRDLGGIVIGDAKPVCPRNTMVWWDRAEGRATYHCDACGNEFEIPVAITDMQRLQLAVERLGVPTVLRTLVEKHGKKRVG